MIEIQKKQDEIIEEQERSNYKAAVLALFQNEIESDKMLLGVSSGAMGLLATFLQKIQYESFVLMALSTLCFVSFGITILYIIRSFQVNKKQFIQIIESGGKRKEIPEVEISNRYKYLSFSIGLLLFTLFILISLIGYFFI